ncbi:Uncharacterised protein [Streptococcus pneumoniae]|nr:Uncharacterised protein [Streptococcus pneumoniae]
MTLEVSDCLKFKSFLRFTFLLIGMTFLWVTGLKFFTDVLMYRICSGVVPQQPPISLTPSLINSCATSPKYCALSLYLNSLFSISNKLAFG